jgi:hypothetical protein
MFDRSRDQKGMTMGIIGIAAILDLRGRFFSGPLRRRPLCIILPLTFKVVTRAFDASHYDNEVELCQPKMRGCVYGSMVGEQGMWA